MRSIAEPPPSGQAIVTPQLAPADPASVLYLDSNISTEAPGKTPELTPYHQKAAFALGDNVHRFCTLHGIDRCAFLTLTFPDNVTDPKEASRRFNSMNTHYLGSCYGAWIWARERQKRGAWHYHLVIECPGDVRTGFDWDEYRQWLTDYSQGKRRRLRTGNPLLRSLWEANRAAFARFGFGRTELLPIRSTVDAVASYVGKYIAKQVSQRPEEDKGVRLTGHSRGWSASSPRFSWNSEGAKQWRRNLALFAIHACGCSGHDDFLEKAPRRWAYRYRSDIMSYHEHYGELYPEAAPF